MVWMAFPNNFLVGVEKLRSVSRKECLWFYNINHIIDVELYLVLNASWVYKLVKK